ncbi:hypothetical protein H4R24_001146 [Coemansia sp. RSA 988]|nr:hypothetical protein H4R24_001146 [Coemansia sp. RSA 988]
MTNGKDRWRSTKGRLSLSELKALNTQNTANEAARKEAVQQVLRDNSSNGMNREKDDGHAMALSNTSFLTTSFVSQLQPLPVELRPIQKLEAAGVNGSGSDPDPGPPDPGSVGQTNPKLIHTKPTSEELLAKDGINGNGTESDRNEQFLNRAFDPALRADLLNAVIIGLVRRSHMLLYAEDAWSEGYTLMLLSAAATQTGASMIHLDIPDWSVMLSQIDPILEDLTIVSHPYSPPPDLEAIGRNEGGTNGGMSFFANINRKRLNDEGDTVNEQINPSWQEEAAHDESAEVDTEDSGTQPNGRKIDLIRSRLGLGKAPGGSSGERLEPSQDDAGDPALSREMMANPLSRDTTEQLDRILSDFVATPKSVDGIERPRIIAIKHLGDLLNTRIGYTLFSRLVLAAAAHNSKTDVQPVAIVGLMHPSLFHPETPPPSIPPFDVNPSTPVALMPREDRSSGSGRGLGDIMESILGGTNQRAAGGNAGVHVVHMDNVAPSNRSARVLGAMPQAATPASTGSKKEVEALPLFARVGIPPPARAALLVPIDMQSPLQTGSDDAGTNKHVIVGSLRQSMVANQCLERNARVIRNICLLYHISGLELDSVESDYFKRMSAGTNFEAEKGKDSRLIFHRRPMYSETNTQALTRQRHGGGWYLDHRPLATMLLTMPDDIARRYFFAETFLHRWISLAHALAVREKLDLKALREDPTLLTKVGSTAVLSSHNLRMAWSQLLESCVALRQGMHPHPSPKSGEVDVVSNSQDGSNLFPERMENDGTEVFSLHQRVDFDEAGIGRRTEDIMDIDPDIPRPKPSVSKDTNDVDNIKSLDTQQEKQQQQFTQWSDIAHKLEPIDEDYIEDGSGSGATRGATVHTPQRRIQLARKGLSDYEQRLMGSVVDPQTIPTGFSQVCVKDETVTTLQEIITLPMLRPEYFSKGVLRRYGVSGILLFGPPGTGKTMLAKAVAKESGSVVLNIRASDIYDKYVGEGEKLAEAVFTLARKLAPCVIFIDEVDALFSARSSGEPNKFRRDIMNQIMSEWDGLNTTRKPGGSPGAVEKSGTAPQVMVMAATNRPFDLDDAILRRLPRRILVDLPGEDDRAKILGIHLKGEELDSDVDLKALAKRTDSFSGSDLKNLCVAAAQVALRERVRAEVAASNNNTEEESKSSGDGQDQLSVSLIEQLKKVRRSQTAGGKPQSESEPIKLATRHFDAALKKVSPSSSDQMESLVELRKWDKIYGDGAQERKRKFHSIGFANAAPEEPKPPKC